MSTSSSTAPTTSQTTPTIRFTCPQCEASYRVPEEMGGRKARCQSCGASFQVPPSVKRMLASSKRAAAGLNLPSASADGTGTIAASPTAAEPEAAVTPSGSDSHAADTDQASGRTTPLPERPSRRTDVISPTKKRPAKAAPQKKKARKWNLLALAGSVLLLLSVFLPWLATTVPGESFLTMAGISPLRLAIDATVLEDAGALNPGGGTPLLLRLPLLLIPVLAFVVLFREWSSRSKGAHPQVALAVAAIGSVVAVLLTLVAISAHGWEIAGEESLAHSLDLAGGLTGTAAVIRQQLAVGAAVWFIGTVLMLLAVLKAARA